MVDRQRSGECRGKRPTHEPARHPHGSLSQTPLGEDPLAPRYFDIDWTLDRTRANTISGYVYNKYGQAMGSVQLVVELLDSSESVIGRRYEWLGRTLTAGTRSYFQVKQLPPAVSYRVAVHAYTILENGKNFP